MNMRYALQSSVQLDEYSARMKKTSFAMPAGVTMRLLRKFKRTEGSKAASFVECLSHMVMMAQKSHV